MTGQDPYADLRAALDTALTGRPGWSQFRQRWSSGEFSAPGQIHTVRFLEICWSPSGPVVRGQKDNAWGQPCDLAEFTDPAEAIAWVETPRSQQPEQHRTFMAQIEAEANRPKPQDIACEHCGAEPGKPCTTSSGKPLGDDVHAKRRTAWNRGKPRTTALSEEP